MNLNIGCGEFYAEGWVNIDLASNPHRKDVECDVTGGLPFVDQQFELAYLGHVLEHISLDRVVPVLHEVARVATLALVVGPDMDRAQLEVDAGLLYDIERGGQRWEGDRHLWVPTAAMTKLICARVFDDVEEIPIADVPEPWPLVSRAPWQCAVLCS